MLPGRGGPCAKAPQFPAWNLGRADRKNGTTGRFVKELTPALDSNPRVACIVLNWNGWSDTIECLDALYQCTYLNVTVIVVDNGSTDDSVASIRGAHPDVLLIESGTNVGFAGGNNIRIRHALAHGAYYLWLLNNDTKPAPDALSA